MRPSLANVSNTVATPGRATMNTPCWTGDYREVAHVVSFYFKHTRQTRTRRVQNQYMLIPKRSEASP